MEMKNIAIPDQKDLWNKLGEKNKEDLEKIENTPTTFAQKASFYIPKDGIVLEIGPGGGRDARYFIREKNCKVFAVDFSKTSLEIMNSAAEKDGTSKNLVPILSDARDLQSFQENSLDLFYAKSSLHLSDNDLYTLFNNLTPALKTGSHIFIEGRTNIDSKIARSTSVDTNLVSDKDGHIRRCWDPDFIKSFCKKFNFELLEISEITEFKGEKQAYFITMVARKKESENLTKPL